MKEATGELNMTVVTVVAIAAVAAFFTIFILPGIKRSLSRNTCENGGGTFSVENGQNCCQYPGDDAPICDGDEE